MVEWESYDGAPSYLFFLFAVPAVPGADRDHLRLIAELAGKLGNEAIMEKLQTVKACDDLVAAFS